MKQNEYIVKKALLYDILYVSQILRRLAKLQVAVN